MSTSTAPRTVTDKQMAFIRKLIAERDLAAVDEIGSFVLDRFDMSMTAKAASGLIDYLLAQPRKPAPVAAATEVEPEAGIYRDANGDLFRVYLGQTSGRMLVKAITEPHDDVDFGPQEVSYTYLGAAARCLPKTAQRLSVEEVGSLGKEWDTCVMCGRRLDDPVSVDRGIGPICAENY